MKDQEFWREIKKIFYDYEIIIRDIRFPEKLDIEIYQLTYLIEGKWYDAYLDHNQEVILEPTCERYEPLFHAQPESLMPRIIGHLSRLNLPLPSKYADYFPLFEEDQQSRNVREIIADALESQKMSNEFFLAWGEYKSSVAVLINFMASDDVEKHEEANIRKNIPSLIERYIFAFWMFEYLINGTDKKEVARDALARRIEELLELNTEFPPWKEKALRNMLTDDCSGIKKTFTEINRAQIVSMVEAAAHFRQLIEIK